MERYHLAIRFGTLLLLLAVLVAGAIACSEVDASGPDEPASTTVQKYFDALKKGNTEEANGYLEDDSQNVYALLIDTSTDMGSYVAEVVSRMEFSIEEIPAATEVTGTSRDGEKMPEQQTVTVHVTTVNVPLLFEQTMKRFTDMYADSLMESTPIPDDELEQRLYALLAEELDSGKAPFLSGYVDVPLIWDGEQWRIEADSTLYNAVTGNYLQIMQYACSNPAGALADDS